jgi:hypothetical protein
MPEGCATFLHIPGEGKGLSDRLEVRKVPEKEPKRALGAISAFQQVEELRQLVSLAASEEAGVKVTADADSGGPPTDEAGQLASWLIHQANFAGV